MGALKLQAAPKLRLLSQEPTGADGPNLYWAFGSNPLSNIDPDGLKNINLIKKGRLGYDDAARQPDDPSVCTVFAHATDTQVANMNPHQLNMRISKEGCPRDMEVRIVACNAGRGSFAQDFANDRGTAVTAPNKGVYGTDNFQTPRDPLPWSWASGIPNPFLPPGKYIRFTPQNP